MTQMDRNLLSLHKAIDEVPEIVYSELSTKDFHTIFAGVSAGSEGCYVEIGVLEMGLSILPQELVSFDSPEKEFLKKEAFDNLSKDCLHIMELVLESPSDIFGIFLTEKQERPTKTRIRQYLARREKWVHTRIDNAFNELMDFARSFI
jgi:hypothetical protein